MSVAERAVGELEPERVEGVVVRYSDEHLLVVDKPAGVTVHPGAGRQHGTLVHALLETGIAGGEERSRPGVVHRLDRDTSGLLVLARDSETHRRLARLVRRRELTREYLALVHGRPRSRAGRIEAPIGRDRRDRTRMSLDTERPRDAVTHFEVARAPAGARAAPGSAGDGEDASDPRAPRSDRPAGLGRPGLRGGARPRPRTPVPPRRPARVYAPRDRRADRRRVTAPARSSRTRSSARRVG